MCNFLHYLEILIIYKFDFYNFGNRMLRILIIVIIFSTELFAGYNNLGTRLYIESKEGYTLDRLVFGINEKATNYLDTALGESELPPFPPPEGIHAGFLFKDTAQNEIIMSYKDYKPFPAHLYDTVKYVLTVMKGAGDIITFKCILSAMIFIQLSLLIN
jgi:hypothetical protein